MPRPIPRTSTASRVAAASLDPAANNGRACLTIYIPAAFHGFNNQHAANNELTAITHAVRGAATEINEGPVSTWHYGIHNAMYGIPGDAELPHKHYEIRTSLADALNGLVKAQLLTAADGQRLLAELHE